MNLDEIKKKLEKKKYFYAFLCPTCGEISEIVMESYSGVIDYDIYVDGDGITHDEMSDYNADDFIRTYMSDCGCDVPYSSTELVVLVWKDSKGIHVSPTSDFSLENDEAKELLEERYDEEIDWVEDAFSVEENDGVPVKETEKKNDDISDDIYEKYLSGWSR